MDYEKKYKEALEIAKVIYQGSYKPDTAATIAETLQNVFPELCESEDEKIRKELLEHCKNQAKPYIQTGNKCPQIQSWIAWLEKQGKPTDINPSEFDLRLNELLKQFETLPKEELVYILSLYLNVVQNDVTYKPDEKKGEQKPTLRERYKKIAESEWFKKTHEGMSVSDDEKVDNVNKVEPKFKVGEWIISDTVDKDYHICKITGIKDGNYSIESIYGNKGYNKFDAFDNAYRLWTIDDAKEGDIICVKNAPFIYYRHDSRYIYTHCTLNFEGEFLSLTPLCWDIVTYYSEIFPAIKEQRDFLFSKMNEAGYEWDAEKKELKKIEQKPVEWHREDEQNLNVCLGYIPDEYLRRWLMDAIHEKYDRPAWNEENEKLTDVNHEYFSELLENNDSKDVNDYAYQVAYCMSHDWANETPTWDDVQKACKLGSEWNEKRNKSAWSEEDEKMFRDLHNLIYVVRDCDCDSKEKLKLSNWLESLRPQNRYTYNPYKEVVSSIAEMCDKYKSFSDDRANDFVNNVKVKCKDAKEYDSIYTQQMDALNTARWNAPLYDSGVVPSV